MTKYHFEIINGHKIDDPVGVECKTEVQAIHLADAIAHQIAVDISDTSARKVVVKEDDGKEIYRVPVNTANKPTE